MKRLFPLILLIAACEESSGDSREDFYNECYSEATANNNIALVQAGQTVCPNLDDVAANCELTDDDYTVNIDDCEVIAKGRCNNGYTYHVIMREFAVKLQIDSPDYSCDTNGFEPYTN